MFRNIEIFPIEPSLRQVLFPVIRFSPVSIIPPLLHTRFHLRAAVANRTNRRSQGTFQIAEVLIYKKQNKQAKEKLELECIFCVRVAFERRCLLLTESFVFQFAIQKFKDQDI